MGFCDLEREINMKEIVKVGNKYNRLTAIKFVEMRGTQQYWLFHCDCGKKKVICAGFAKRGKSKSCGCLQREVAKEIGKNIKIHGMHGTRTHRSWMAMKNRCLNKNAERYNYYGGRGITICKEWLKFENFYSDMGVRPQGKSIDRINNNGNYLKSNCKWSTPKEQANNRRRRNVSNWYLEKRNATERYIIA